SFDSASAASASTRSFPRGLGAPLSSSRFSRALGSNAHEGWQRAGLTHASRPPAAGAAAAPASGCAPAAGSALAVAAARDSSKMSITARTLPERSDNPLRFEDLAARRHTFCAGLDLLPQSLQSLA